MPYTIVDGIACGSAELQVKEVFHKLPQIFAGMHVVATYTDSVPTVAEDGEIKLNYKYGRRLGKAVLLNQLLLKELIDLLDGFDEIFVVPAEALQDFPQVDGYATPPYFSEEIPQDFLETFKALGAVCYLGDGIGLNYACAPEFAPLIEKLPDLETYHLRVLPYKLDRSGPFDPKIIGPIDIRKRSLSLDPQDGN